MNEIIYLSDYVCPADMSVTVCICFSLHLAYGFFVCVCAALFYI